MATTSKVFHAEGDLTLVVGGSKTQACRMRVFSQVMRVASPVWNAMLSGRWPESKQSEVELPEDDPSGMTIIMNIAHARYNHIPRIISDDHLLQISILCDKYQMVESLKTFLDSWNKSLKSSKLSAPDAAFVTYVFERQHDFHDRAIELLYELEVNDDDGPVFEGLPLLTSGKDYLNLVLRKCKISISTDLQIF